MKRVLAISGGVDSMVLLDFCVKKFDKNEIVVAHFDHGTRKSSKNDAEFVEKSCEKYGVKFYGGVGNLGENVSEELAREKRYEFLRKVAAEEEGIILTAHHLDDLVETVAINFMRGTGWRGLAVFGSKDIERPLLTWSKREILRYAAENGIVFREDPTNSSEKYLRNRVRKKVREMSEEKKREIFLLWKEQVRLKGEIEEEAEKVLKKMREFCSEKNEMRFSREVFREVPEKVGVEIIYFLLKANGLSATRPQRLDFLRAICEYESGKQFNLPKNRLVKIKKDYFVI